MALIVLQNKRDWIANLPFVRDSAGDPVGRIREVQPGAQDTIDDEYLVSVGERGRLELAELIRSGAFDVVADYGGGEPVGEPIGETPTQLDGPLLARRQKKAK